MESNKKNKLSLQQLNDRLDEIAWIHSHQLRKPLSQILGLIELMEDNGPFNGDHEEIISKLRLSANELDHFIKEIIKKAEQNLC